MDQPLLTHDGAWSEAEYRALDDLPGDGRVELVEGALWVGPGSVPAHGEAVAAVRTAVEAALPEGLRVHAALPLRLGTDCVLVPDLVVTRVGDSAELGVLDSTDVLMVIEVVGTEHGIADRSFKPQLYARSRIPYALLVDRDAPFGLANMLIGGRYHEFASAGAGEHLVLEEPFALDVDLGALAAAAGAAPAAEPTPAGSSAADQAAGGQAAAGQAAAAQAAAGSFADGQAGEGQATPGQAPADQAAAATAED